MRRRRPEAEPLYDRFCERLDAKKGVFGACMGVALVNDGPVTLTAGGLNSVPVRFMHAIGA